MCGIESRKERAWYDSEAKYEEQVRYNIRARGLQKEIDDDIKQYSSIHDWVYTMKCKETRGNREKEFTSPKRDAEMIREARDERRDILVSLRTYRRPSDRSKGSIYSSSGGPWQLEILWMWDSHILWDSRVYILYIYVYHIYHIWQCCTFLLILIKRSLKIIKSKNINFENSN